MDNIKYTKADAIPKLFSHCIRLSVIVLFIFYLFTLLLYYLFTLYHINTLLWLHIAKESTVKVIVVALGWSLDNCFEFSELMMLKLVLVNSIVAL